MANLRTCFECGDTGHLAYSCPNRAYLNSVSFMRRPADAPTGEYLAERARLGMPSASLADLLTVTCPWCGASAPDMCVNPATGQRKPQAHDARYSAAKIKPPRDGILRRIAREQAAESRASRRIL